MNSWDAVRHDQEQDEANALKWWRETPDTDKVRVWLAIQKLGGDAMSEVISRFAQLGYCHVALIADADARRAAAGEGAA